MKEWWELNTFVYKNISLNFITRKGWNFCKRERERQSQADGQPGHRLAEHSYINP